MRRLILPVALGALLTACDSASPPADAPADAAPPPAAQASAQAGEQAGASAPAAAPVEGLLSKEGFMLPNPGGRGTGREVRFGEAEADVVAFMNGMFGEAKLTRGANAECPAGPLTFADWGNGLQLAFQDGKFAGWSADDRLPPGYSTLSGLAFGKTLGAMKAASPGLVLTESTVGPEFALDGVHGIVTGKGDDARLKVLWAGVSCQFR